MMYVPVVILLACLTTSASSKSAKAVDCGDRDEQIAALKAQVESLKTQLKAAQTSGESDSCTPLGIVAKTSSIATDVVQHLLGKTDVDEKVAGIVSGQVEAAKAMTSKVVDQINAHPCSSGYDQCVSHVTSSPHYQTHAAPHVSKLASVVQPHVETAKVHINPALESVQKAYSSAADHVQTKVVPALMHSSSVAMGHASDVASKTPGHIQTVLEPIFGAFSAASPKHGHALPKDPIDRLLLIVVLVVVVYSFWFILRLAMKLIGLTFRMAVLLGVKVPFKVTTKTMSWGFFFGTGFYVCGLCRKRKEKQAANDKTSPDAKAEPKKNGATKPATEKELVAMLTKTQEKGKLTDGVTRLATAAKTGKALQAPDEMKGKTVSKDLLKKALTKFKEVDIKKLGL